MTWWDLLKAILSPEVFAAALLVVAGALAYRMQKAADHSATLKELRRSLYQDYLSNLVRFGAASERVQDCHRAHVPAPNNWEDQRVEADSALKQAAAKLSIVASGEVLRKLGEFEAQRSGQIISEPIGIDLLQAFRRDVFDGAQVEKETLRKVFPIKL